MSGQDHFKLYLGVHKQDIATQMKGVATFDEFVKYFTFVHGVMMCLSGLFIMTGERTFGPVMLIMNMMLLVVVQDIALLNDKVKPAPKTRGFKYSDLTRHISVIGGAIFMMTTPSPDEVLRAEPTAKVNVKLNNKADKVEESKKKK